MLDCLFLLAEVDLHPLRWDPVFYLICLGSFASGFLGAFSKKNR